MRILNFGSMNLDDVYSVDHFVQPGETLTALSRTVKAGGKGLNQSIALARAGAPVCHAGCVGTGGEALKTLLEVNGVDTRFLLPVSEIQGHTIIQVNRKGENCILLFGGSNRCIPADHIRKTIRQFEAGDWLILQNEINDLPLIAEQAFKQGMQIVLNPSPCDDSLADVDFSKLSWLMMNEIEAERIAGTSDPERAWMRLHAEYPRLSALFTLGAQGSAAFRTDGTDAETAWCDAIRVKAVDTTAAGDTYTGYFLAALTQGMPLKACMGKASRAAAISVTRFGAADSIPWDRELDHHA